MSVHDRKTWTVPFDLTRVIDGDTLEGDADLGWGIGKRKLSVRIESLWSPELSTPEGKAAKEWAISALADHKLALTLQSTWVLSFTRVVGSIYLPGDISYAKLCVEAGHGVLR